MPIAPVGVDPETAERYGRQIAVALVRGNWDHAHSVIATARHECETAAKATQPDDPREIGLHNTTIPPRLISILEGHGLFTVGDLLIAGPQYLVEQKNLGHVSVQMIAASLLEIGITIQQFRGPTYDHVRTTR